MEEGLAHTFDYKTEDQTVFVISRITDIDTGARDERNLPIPGWDDLDVHARMSADTYYSKRLLPKHVGAIVEGEDDDGNAAQGSYRAKSSPNTKPSNPWAAICKLVKEDKVTTFQELGSMAQGKFGTSSIKDLSRPQQQELIDEVSRVQNTPKKVADVVKEQFDNPPPPSDEDLPF
jgi:hypothetical protein